jgi:short-subunit dehydrogenase
MSRLVLITGASSGIGQALALAYAQAGWRLALVARRESAMRAWLDAAGLAQAPVRLYVADVGDAEAMRDVGLRCIASQGVPDVVIANAGISHGFSTEVLADLAQFERTLRTNVLGVAHTFHPFVTAMRERGHGHLVGVSSVAGVRGMPGHGAYCASKSACTAYCESLRGELRGTGVKVTALLPGYIDTPLTRDNPFPMPFLMAAPAFAQQAMRVIEQGRALAVIPWPMAWVAALLKLLPASWLDRALAKQPRKRRVTGDQP